MAELSTAIFAVIGVLIFSTLFAVLMITLSVMLLKVVAWAADIWARHRWPDDGDEAPDIEVDELSDSEEAAWREIIQNFKRT